VKTSHAPQPQAVMSRNQKIFLCLLLTAHIFTLVLGMFYRYVDGDEGGTLVVSREVINGRIPVLDINAHNQPLLYYFYGAWMEMFSGNSIAGARALNVLSMFLTGALLLWWVYRFTANYWVTIILYFLYITNLTYFKTNIPVKPFALSNLLTFSSFAVITSYYFSGGKRLPVVFLSGLLLGASMGVRLMFTLPFAFVAWIIIVGLRERESLKEIATKTLLFCGGVALPLVPSVLIFLKEPLRAYAVWAGAYAQIYLGKGSNPDFAVDIYRGLKGGFMINGAISVLKVPDLSLLLLLAIVSIFVYFFRTRHGRDSRRADVYLLLWLIFVAVIWVSSSLFIDYLSYINQAVIFLILLCFPVAELAAKGVSPRKFAICSLTVLVLLGGLFYAYFQKRHRTSIFYALRSSDSVITPAFVNSVSEDVIKKVTRSGDVIFDQWGVFVFASGRRPLNGYEYPTDMTHYWYFMTEPWRAWKYLYIPEPEVLSRLKMKEIPLVILNEDPRTKLSELDERTGASRHTAMLKGVVEENYTLYERHFVKPGNTWMAIYVPKNNARQPFKPVPF